MSAVYAWTRLHLIALTLETCARASISRTHVLLPRLHDRVARIALPSTLERHLLSQDGPRACDLPAARVDVAAAIGGAGAVERIKRVREADAVVALGFCEGAGDAHFLAGYTGADLDLKSAMDEQRLLPLPGTNAVLERSGGSS
ncbi:MULTISPECIES: hypothetical protein [unclassified Bradyrhizobium]|uniref:hypothetical protein n=1 Tax=unclassified Bradyrhizobium TaxID=2631580 RepID=UPI001CD45A83|nr:MULTISPECIES: hypothetical protein [unclassified Bradyrhizobium]MCA1384449.1 hypothetical protein [Bradyrhizobium sp. BRP05]MCA1421178.1 hypothetical protein [Bradyrhizobium sp. BRP23]MCA1479249.1 hypothetical protein [Bradyrhizobium sp. NBAIM08]